MFIKWDINFIRKINYLTFFFFNFKVVTLFNMPNFLFRLEFKKNLNSISPCSQTSCLYLSKLILTYLKINLDVIFYLLLLLLLLIVYDNIYNKKYIYI